MRCRSWGMHCESCSLVCRDERGPNKKVSAPVLGLLSGEHMHISLDYSKEYVTVSYSVGGREVDWAECYKYPMMTETVADERLRIAGATARAVCKCIELMEDEQ